MIGIPPIGLKSLVSLALFYGHVTVIRCDLAARGVSDRLAVKPMFVDRWSAPDHLSKSLYGP